MRVESKRVAQQEMVKKKHRLKKQQKDANEFPDSSDEGGAEGPFCHHVNKAVNFNLVKKAIKTHGITGDCINCKSESSGDHSKRSEPEQREAAENIEDCTETTVWLCLQCGNQGCDRNSKHKHALKHFETPRSGSHDICVNLTTCLIWCYTCDNEVLLETSKKLSECVEFVKKQLGSAPSQQVTGKKVSHHRSVPEVTEEISHDKDTKEKQVHNQNKSKVSTAQSLVLPKVKGLSNLGNTCFFNAVMQNISQTPILATILSEHIQKGTKIQLCARQVSCDTDSDESAHNSCEEDKEVKGMELSAMSITLGDGGVLSGSVLSFMKDMHHSASKGPVVTPSTLFGQVCKKAPRFKGFQQQDSHELLRYLLDGMKAEEIKRSQAGILSAFSLPTNINNRQVDEETKEKVKGYGVQVKHTFIDSIFGGLFISTVQCEECCMPSQILEPFLDVSLPVTEEKTIRPSNLGRKKNDKDNRTEPVTAANEITYKPSKPSKHTTKKERKKTRKEKKRKKKISESKDTTAEGTTGDKGHGEAAKEDENDDDDDDSVEEVDDNDVQNESVQTKEENREDTQPSESAPNHIDFDNSYHHTTDMDSNNVGLSLEDIQSKDQDRSKDSDSNKAVGTNSEGNLSDLDADVEDNLDGNRISPIDKSLKDSKDNLCDDTMINLDGNSKHTSRESQVTDNLLTDNLSKLSDKELTSHSDKAKFAHNSGSNTNLNSIEVCSNGVKVEEITDNFTLKDCKPMNGVLTEITENLKHINLSYDKNDDEIAHINDRKFNNVDDSENMQKTSLSCRNMQNTSRPNTPQSPKLSRSASLRMSNNTKSKHQIKVEARQEAMKVISPTRYQPDSHECSVQSCLNQFTAAELLTGSNKFGCEFCTNKKRKGTDKDGKKEMVYTNASKQVLIFSPPAVLTLHMKRFQQIGYSLRKVNRHVDFPLILDLAPYCSALSQGVKSNQNKVIYSLYGIVEHSGRLTGGHYTAFVKVRPNSSHIVKAFIQYNSLHGLNLDKVLIENLDTMNGGEGAVGGLQEDDISPPPGKWYYISDSRVSETTESNVLRCQAYLLFYERIY